MKNCKKNIVNRPPQKKISARKINKIVETATKVFRKDYAELAKE